MEVKLAVRTGGYNKGIMAWLGIGGTFRPWMKRVNKVTAKFWSPIEFIVSEVPWMETQLRVRDALWK